MAAARAAALGRVASATVVCSQHSTQRAGRRWATPSIVDHVPGLPGTQRHRPVSRYRRVTVLIRRARGR